MYPMLAVQKLTAEAQQSALSLNDRLDTESGRALQWRFMYLLSRP